MGGMSRFAVLLVFIRVQSQEHRSEQSDSLAQAEAVIRRSGATRATVFERVDVDSYSASHVDLIVRQNWLRFVKACRVNGVLNFEDDWQLLEPNAVSADTPQIV